MSYAERIAGALRALAPNGVLLTADVPLIDQLAAQWEAREPCPTYDPANPLTCKVALEIVGHEAIVQEWYLDSESVGTWGIGVTDRSGHRVERYKDNPQPIERCLEVYLWLLRERYIPDVLDAFARPLTEAQFAAALSFHYNTGGIGRAEWVKSWNAGYETVSREQFMEWRKPALIIERREKERDLFFDGAWSQDGKALVIPVRKPSYRPQFGAAKRVDVTPILARLLQGSPIH